LKDNKRRAQAYVNALSLEMKKAARFLERPAFSNRANHALRLLRASDF
jgi:hypothetical protein